MSISNDTLKQRQTAEITITVTDDGPFDLAGWTPLIYLGDDPADEYTADEAITVTGSAAGEMIWRLSSDDTDRPPAHYPVEVWLDEIDGDRRVPVLSTSIRITRSTRP